MKSQQEDGREVTARRWLEKYIKEIFCEVAARRWFGKSQQGYGL